MLGVIVEISYVGHANRAELDSSIERVSRWGWPLADNGAVTILADSHADHVGVRLERSLLGVEEIATILADLLDGAIVCRAIAVPSRRPTTATRKGT